MNKIITFLVIFVCKSVAFASPIEIISPIAGTSNLLECSRGYELLNEVCVSKKAIAVSTPEELIEAIKIFQTPKLVKTVEYGLPPIVIVGSAFKTHVKKVENDTIILRNGGIVKMNTQNRYQNIPSKSSIRSGAKCILFKERFDWNLLIKKGSKYKLYQVDLLGIPETVPRNINTIKEFVELL